ncbi:hypothetical protein LTR56_001573 [Elasticomyces elasticus]|nr:hypothetical protein LTR56_001573 [Elasticomyces elasticus]KAK3667375.1 hypothetical protein LTR22_001891 [Elasticomyces elasticus]KAK4932545.1 hypothetical protein LTR49_000969 [Elasticomyces elasticus]KAK5769567.1 hypothetical protein LTS12_000017 [Elasticomyces elasticus]
MSTDAQTPEATLTLNQQVTESADEPETYFVDQETGMSFYTSKELEEYQHRDRRPAREDRELFVDNPAMRCGREGFKYPLKIQTPHPYDLVYIYAKAADDEHNARLIAAATHPLHVFTLKHDRLTLEALSISPTMFYEGGCDSTPAVHVLVRHELFVKVQLKLVCDIEFGDDDRWIRFAEFLKTLKGSTMSTVGWSGYHLQHLWWREMKRLAKTVKSAGAGSEVATLPGPMGDLEKLPVELRSTMLLHCIGESVMPHQEYITRGQSQVYVTFLTRGENMRLRGYSGHRHGQYPPRAVYQSNTNILRLNQATRALALQVLNKDTIKVYHDRVPLMMHTSPNYQFLRRLELAFSNIEYINFFRVDVPPFNGADGQISTWQGITGAEVLKDLDLLTELQLHFRPSDETTTSP